MKTKSSIAITAALALLTTAAHAAVFTTDATINIGDTNYDGQDIVVSNCTLTVNGPHSFTSLLVTSNGVITHAADPDGTIGNRLDLTILTDATVALGGAIQANGLGYGGGQGPGAGGSLSCNFGAGGGGGHGGLGGAGNDGCYSVPGGVAYGSVLQPTTEGSGGGGYNGAAAGAGGGAIQMTVGGTLTVQGQISANGLPAAWGAGGGGAGGSIWLTVGTLSSTGVISANGGPSVGAYGGGGAGGRIAIYQTNNLFAGTLAALGGAGYQNGGAGTVYTKASGAAVGSLVLDNGGTVGALTPLTAPEPFALTIGGQALVYPETNLTLRSLVVASNGTLLHLASQSGLNLVIQQDATVALGGTIQAAGLGYGGGQGPGAGGTVQCDWFAGGGGGHGGLGGAGNDGCESVPGGVAYGSVLQPTTEGSGGGSGGGAGGGAIQMTVGGTLTVQGQISANGLPGSGNGGGGSGGSIWLTVGTLSGTGVISASGGPSVSAYGGGGAGGRIAIYQTNNFFAGTLSAWGGIGGQHGGAGTIYTKAASLNTGDLLVDNGGTNGAMTLLTSPVAFNLIITNGAVVYSAAPVLFNNLTVAAGGAVTHLPALLGVQINCLGDVTIQAGGVIQASGLGYGGGQGPGAGVSLSCNFGAGGGGGHGGLGGAGSDGCDSVPGGAAYGSVLQPTTEGSGGGLGWGGAGGGAIQMTVAGTLTVNGQIQANGLPGWLTSGGGSGGSIWLTVGTLSGTGVISASGGPSVSAYGGGGAGGRIAIYGTISSVQTPIIAMNGGTGYTSGGTGSYYTSTTYSPPMVIAQSPSGQLNRFVSYVDVTFNQPVDPGTFTNTDLVLTAPSGSIPASQITLTGGGGPTWRIGFPTQTANGDYSLTVGPHVANLFGQEMPSAYQGAFNIQFTPPVFSSSLNGTNFKLSWPTVAGLNYQIQSTTNLSAASWVNEGAPFTGTGGALTNTISVGADSEKFFRLLLLEN